MFIKTRTSILLLMSSVFLLLTLQGSSAQQRYPAFTTVRLQGAEQGNTKTMLAIFYAIEQRDGSHTPQLFQPDFEIHWPPSLPYGGTFRGLEPKPHGWSATWEPLQPTEWERRMDPTVIAAQGDAVVVLWHQRGIDAKGDRFDGEVLGLYHFRDGRLARAQMFYFDTVAVKRFLAIARK